MERITVGEKEIEVVEIFPAGDHFEHYYVSLDGRRFFQSSLVNIGPHHSDTEIFQELARWQTLDLKLSELALAKLASEKAESEQESGKPESA